jgi:hypothetical protein
MGGYVVHMGERSTYGRDMQYIWVTEAYRVLLRKSKGIRALARPRRREEDKIKIFRMWCGWGIDWIYRAQDKTSGWHLSTYK